MQKDEKRCARVTRRGIRVNKQFYSCSLAIREGWFERAAMKGGWRIAVVFKQNTVFIPRDEDLIPCQRIEFGITESSKIEAYFESIRVLKDFRRHHRGLKQ